MADREIADIYTALRDQALSWGSVEIKAPPPVPGGRALGVLMDMGYDTAVVSVLGLADGTTSMYISHGGGTLGLGEDERAAAASKRWVALAEAAQGLAESGDDSLPAEGRIRFTVLTTGPRLTAEVAEADVTDAGHPLFPLFVAGQDVITEIRRVDEARNAAG